MENVETKWFRFKELHKDVQKSVIENWAWTNADQGDMFDTDDEYYETYVEELIGANPSWRFTEGGELGNPYYTKEDEEVLS